MTKSTLGAPLAGWVGVAVGEDAICADVLLDAVSEWNEDVRDAWSKLCVLVQGLWCLVQGPYKCYGGEVSNESRRESVSLSWEKWTEWPRGE